MSFEMQEFCKINSVFKRDEKGRFIMGEFSCPEFDYLLHSPWRWTEKIDGTNIRVLISLDDEGHPFTKFGGRTDNAQMQTPLLDRLVWLFPDECAHRVLSTPGSLVLYGEGYGKKIQKVGSLYNPDGVDFILFDVKVGKWWLQPEAVAEIAANLGVRCVPVVHPEATLWSAIEMVSHNLVSSEWPGVPIEGLVGTPTTGFLDRGGRRVIVKIKGIDFRERD